VDRLYMQFPYYGTRRVSLHLRREAHDVGRDLVRSLMAAANWRTVHPGPRTSRPQPDHKMDPYLLGGLEAILPGEAICADITYIPVRGGNLCLAPVMDWASRFVLSWELDNRFIERLRRSLKYEAVYLEELADGHHARRVIAPWLDHYNHRRLHLALNGATPSDVYFPATTLQPRQEAA